MEGVHYVFRKFLDTYLLPAISSTFIALMYFFFKRREKNLKKPPQAVLNEVVIYQNNRKSKQMVSEVSNFDSHFLGDQVKTINLSTTNIDIPNKTNAKNIREKHADVNKYSSVESKCSRSETKYFMSKKWDNYGNLNHNWCLFYHLRSTSILKHGRNLQSISQKKLDENGYCLNWKVMNKNFRFTEDEVDCSKSTLKCDVLDCMEKNVRNMINDKKAFSGYLHLVFDCD